jgi:SAM-dependent methyltransferase
VSTFSDHFSAQAADYARHRPGYPPELFQLLLETCDQTEQAWDVGTGNGQAALRLAEDFQAVMATDASAEQLRHATPHPRIRYRQACEDDSGLPDHSTDLVCAAQAAHWFAAPRFHAEVQRVLRPGGLLALWGYGLAQVDETVDRLVWDFYDGQLGAWWPPERRHIDEGYRTLAFPFPELPAPELCMQSELSGAQYLGYLGTWSALARARQAKPVDPLQAIARELGACWPLEEVRSVRWPLFLRWGRCPG